MKSVSIYFASQVIFLVVCDYNVFYNEVEKVRFISIAFLVGFSIWLFLNVQHIFLLRVSISEISEIWFEYLEKYNSSTCIQFEYQATNTKQYSKP